MPRQFRSDDTSKWPYGFGLNANGVYSSVGNATDAPIDSSCSGTSGTTSLSATNASFAAGQMILIHQTRGTGAGSWELNRILSYVSGTITTEMALQNTYGDSGASQAQVLVMPQYSSFTQNSGHTLTAKAWNGNVGGIIAFFCSGTTTITGIVTATGKGYVASGDHNTGEDGDQGEGTTGAGGTHSTVANGNGGGGTTRGGDPNHSVGGGGGGHANSGGTGQNDGGTSGTGGGTAGNAALTSMVFGGAGGQGAVANGHSGGPGGGAGSGGGIIFIISRSIVFTGTAFAGGLNGGASFAGEGTGGGGAGGSILLKCQSATLGSGLITAAAGTATAAVGKGGDGSVGRIHLDYSGSVSGTTSPTLDSRLDVTVNYPVGGAALIPLFI